MALPPPRTPTISDETLLYLSTVPGCPHALDATIPLQALLPSSPSTSSLLIPAFIESIQKLQTMGFNPAASVLILDKYDVTSVEFRGDLLSVAKGLVRNHPGNVWLEQGVKEWRRALGKMDVVWELREGILGPVNEELRHGEEEGVGMGRAAARTSVNSSQRTSEASSAPDIKKLKDWEK